MQTKFLFSLLQGSNQLTGFIQEALAGVDKRHIGAELGIEAQVTPTIKLKGAASVGQYTYDNNPFVYLTSTSDDFLDSQARCLVRMKYANILKIIN